MAITAITGNLGNQLWKKPGEGQGAKGKRKL
jgi:hypothetical protein